MTDYQPYYLNRRGRPPAPYMAKKLIITSALAPHEVYHNLAEHDTLDQLYRRINLIKLAHKCPGGNTKPLGQQKVAENSNRTGIVYGCPLSGALRHIPPSRPVPQAEGAPEVYSVRAPSAKNGLKENDSSITDDSKPVRGLRSNDELLNELYEPTNCLGEV